VVGIDAQRGKLALTNDRGDAITLDPRKQSKLAIYERRSLEVGEGDLLVAGERMSAKRGGKESTLQNGERLKVTKAEKSAIQVENRAGQSFQLDISKRTPVINHGYANTAHAAQGMTYERVIGHFESTRSNLANQQTFYVAISRARDHATIVTDDKASLGKQIARESGQKLTALGETLTSLGIGHQR
jgi:ATP-dependent exoDNAse (exonuclease V) alpha subunit